MTIDWQQLEKKSLLFDELFSMIPLQITTAVSSSGAVEPLSAASSTEETRRLRRERAFLLERIQNQCRLMESRCDAVKAHFQQELREVRSRRLELCGG